MAALPQILLLTHGGWGQQLRESVRMVIGETSGVFDIALMPVDTLAEFHERVEQQVKTMPEGSSDPHRLYRRHNLQRGGTLEP